ncbi:MAG: hypothetical protein ABIB43_02770 [archaeon]
MVISEEKEEMRDFIVEALIQTNEFSNILAKPTFKGQTILDKALNKYADDHILATKKPELVKKGESDQYLIVLDTKLQNEPIREVGERLAAASVLNMYTTHILLKSRDPNRDFFRRKTRVNKDKTEAKYREPNAYNKNSLNYLDHIVKNSALDLSERERGIIKAMTNNRVPYYQTESARLHEKLLLIQYVNTRGHYQFGEATHKKWNIPKRLLETETFTLMPNNYNYPDSIAYDLETAMRNKYKLRKALGDQPAKIARVLNIPNIETDNIEAIKLRYNLALMDEKMSKHETFTQVDLDLRNRIQEQLVNIKGFTEVYEALEDNYIELENQISLERTSPTVFTAKHESISEPGKIHTTKLIMNSSDMSTWEYQCTPCPGFHYWDHCWHVDKIKEDVWHILKK